ncbi:hypothetical protein GYMLUDRAFT_144224, partial [Collybiopsis luxurians FD-317 M1]
YLTVLAVYRLFFHPLHKFPGPVLAALTSWYEIYRNLVQGGELVSDIKRLHEIYGPVVRTGPNTV